VFAVNLLVKVSTPLLPPKERPPVPANGRPALPLEVKQRRGTMRGDRLPTDGLIEISRLPTDTTIPEAPEHLQAPGRLFWGRIFDAAPWLWPNADVTLIEHTAGLVDEQKQLRELIDQAPEDMRFRAALRALDKQLVSNLSLLGLTPSDRSRLGYVQVKAETKLDALFKIRDAREAAREAAHVKASSQ
jgi:hypothetical protein